MSAEDGRRPSMDPPQGPETRGDNRLAFLIATTMCVASGIVGLRTGNPGGFVAFGMGALSAIGAIRS